MITEKICEITMFEVTHVNALKNFPKKIKLTKERGPENLFYHNDNLKCHISWED